MTPDSSGFSDRPLSADDLRAALAAALGVDPSALALLSGREAAAGLERLRTLQERVALLEERASTDELTGVLRRGAGLDALEREVGRARRSGDPLVIAFLDVDGLKKVNDQLGHAAGDQLLVDVATVLRARLRSYDLVVRWGGDEFVCALYGAEPEDARRRLEAVAAGIVEVTGGRTVSWGMVALEGSDSAASLIGRADAALYDRRRSTADQDTAGAP